MGNSNTDRKKRVKLRKKLRGRGESEEEVMRQVPIPAKRAISGIELMISRKLASGAGWDDHYEY